MLLVFLAQRAVRGLLVLGELQETLGLLALREILELLAQQATWAPLGLLATLQGLGQITRTTIMAGIVLGT